VWDFGEYVPTDLPPGSKIVHKDFGNVMLDGDVYNVVDEPCTVIQQEDGVGRYNISPL
jgi:hypothetical protein